jgi:hypothetical protein
MADRERRTTLEYLLSDAAIAKERTPQDVLKDLKKTLDSLKALDEDVVTDSPAYQILTTLRNKYRDELAGMQGLEVVPGEKRTGLFGKGFPNWDWLAKDTKDTVRPRGKAGKVATPKPKFKSTPEDKGPHTKKEFAKSAKAVSAPDIRLDAVWSKLPTSKKAAVWKNLKKVVAALDNGYSVDEVLGAL